MLTLLTLIFHFQIEVVFGIKQKKNSTGSHTDPHNTKLEGYRHLHLHRQLQHSHIPSSMM